MNTTTYSEKLTNPLWQKKRLEILNRDLFTCQLCSDTETTLHVHHKEYLKGREPWEYEDSNFQTLCKHCHKLVEGTDGQLIITTKQELMGGAILFFSIIDVGNGMSFLISELDTEGDVKYIYSMSKETLNGFLNLFEHAEKLIHG